MNKKLVYVVYALLFVAIYIIQLLDIYNFKTILCITLVSFLVLAALSSGLLVSGNRMRANNAVSNNEDRFVTSKLFLLLSIPPAIIILISYITIWR